MKQKSRLPVCSLLHPGQQIFYRVVVERPENDLVDKQMLPTDQRGPHGRPNYLECLCRSLQHNEYDRVERFEIPGAALLDEGLLNRSGHSVRATR